jgi:hypothetical protein
MLRVLTLIFIFISFGLKSQIVDYTYPENWKEKSIGELPFVNFPEVDHFQLKKADSLNASNKEVPYRFAKAFDTKINIKQSGSLNLDKYGNKYWQLQINVPGAFGVGFIFNYFLIPDRAKLFIYNGDKSALIGAITSINNNENQVLSVMPIQGSTIVIHYFEPNDAEFSGEIELGFVTHVYRDIFNTQKGFGDSGNCNVNVVCPEGSEWEKQVRSVAMIVTNNGTRWCTGTLVNNTNNDNTPYFLTANHCLMNTGDDPATWSVIFNYKSPECSPAQDGLLGNSVFGAEVKASNSINDFALLELNQSPPDDYNIYYSGWSRNTDGITDATGVHHPNGDVMKISNDFDPPVLSAYLGGSGDDYWRVIDWDSGTTEGGSSGSALFNNNYQIIGQLRGGQAACNNNLSDYYGAFYKSWDGINSSNRLKDWLDPDNFNPDTLNGNDPLIDVILESNLQKQIFIYPNPAKDWVNLQFNAKMKINKIRLIDMSGREVRVFPLNGRFAGNLEISLSGINSGLYQLIVYSDNLILSYKLVVN